MSLKKDSWKKAGVLVKDRPSDLDFTNCTYAKYNKDSKVRFFLQCSDQLSHSKKFNIPISIDISIKYISLYALGRLK